MEYALLIAGVALISMAAVSILGHKIGEMVSVVAVTLPGAHPGDNGPIVVGRLVETTTDAHGHITLDTLLILNRSRTDRLGANLFGFRQDGHYGLGRLIVETD